MRTQRFTSLNLLTLGLSLAAVGCTGGDDDGTPDAADTGSTGQADDTTGGPDSGPDEDDSGSTSASSDGSGSEDTTGGVEATRFQVTLYNASANYLAEPFAIPDGAEEAGPLTSIGDAYTVDFRAVPGTRLTFASMSAATNDWVFAPDGSGIELFDGDGNAIVGDVTDQVSLWDMGTEEEDPATIATEPGGGKAGDPDDDDTVRIQQDDVSGELLAELSFDAGVFTLRVERLGDAILTPGVAVVHSVDNPLFEVGQPDYGDGLVTLAEAGSPADIVAWLSEAGEDGAPLRVSVAHSPLSPGVAYAFEAEDGDPLFVQGEPAIEGSGLEELAEAGNNQVTFDYLDGLGVPVALSEPEGGVLPGGALTFTIEAVPGYNLGFASMFVQSNDWFVAFNNDGVPLFNEDGTPNTGVASSVQSYLFDAGTEVDEPVGQGANQAPRQDDPDMGDADPDDLVRRVGEIEDVQFGKGTITSGPGVVSLEDPRGGYNLVVVSIEVAE